MKKSGERKLMVGEECSGVNPMNPMNQMKKPGERSSLLAEEEVCAEVNYSALSAALIFFFPALGGLLFGYDIGATSAIVPQLQSETNSGVMWFGTVANSSLLVGVITSAGMVGALLGCLVCFQLSEWLGRRGTILVAAVLYMCGAAVEFTSGSPAWSATTGITVLIVGRVIYGTGCGWAMIGAPNYIGEMAPPSIRGLLMSLKEGMIVLGMLLGYTIGYLYSTTPGGWRATYGWSALVAVGMFAGTYYLPDSMPWLAIKGRVAEGVDALRFVFPQLTFAQVRSVTDIAHKSARFPPVGQGGGSFSSLRADWVQLTTGAARPALVAALGLVVLQQVTGQPRYVL
jgi:MFS family permease